MDYQKGKASYHKDKASNHQVSDQSDEASDCHHVSRHSDKASHCDADGVSHHDKANDDGVVSDHNDEMDGDEANPKVSHCHCCGEEVSGPESLHLHLLSYSYVDDHHASEKSTRMKKQDCLENSNWKVGQAFAGQPPTHPVSAIVHRYAKRPHHHSPATLTARQLACFAPPQPPRHHTCTHLSRIHYRICF
jgi:hypothetical protein